MKHLKQLVSVVTCVTTCVIGSPLTLAAEFRLPQGQDKLTSDGAIHISPEAFRQLTPEQQLLIQQRIQKADDQQAGSPTPSPSADPNAIKPIEESVELSDFERELAARPPEAISLRLKHFGYEMFAQAPTTFAPVDDAPVPSDYVLAPGDELLISVVSPRRSGDYTLTVNRDGTLLIPNIGTMSVAGMTYSKAVEVLTQKIKGGARDMQLSIRMGKLRTIKVFVVGRVSKPGAYTISAFSTLSNAVMASGGPSKAGSLRDIQLKRAGKIVARFDYYDFLMKGDSSKDQRLQPGDVVFIPDAGTLVGVAGSVKTPGIYELKGRTTLREALALAGNITAMGYTQQVQVERMHQNQSRKILDVDMRRQGAGSNLVLQDGDVVKIFPISQKLLNGIYLTGNVERPGKYEYRPNLRVRDILQSGADLKPESYMDFALIERIMPPDDHIELLPFHLGRLLAGDGTENKQLQPGDTLRIYYRWDIQEQPKVKITGAIHHEGQYQLRPKMTIAELVQLAGGLKYFADTSTAELTRVRIENNKLSTQRLVINLGRALQGDASSNMVLEKDDYLLVKSVPEYKLYRTITLQGEVAQPGTYTYQDGETLSELITRAGGLTRRAYPKGAIFTRQSVKRLQEDRLRDMAQRLEGEIFRSSSQEVSAALSTEAARANLQALDAKKQLLASIKDTKASGRMIVKVEALLKQQHSDADIQLEEGDVLVVPPIVNSISVLGQVYNPTAITYEQNLRAEEYLSKAGGPTEHADTHDIYVIKADGSVMTDKTFQTGWGPWRRGVLAAVLEPGDTIVVPEKLSVDTTIRDVRDITQILFQIATAAAATWGLIRK